MNKKPFSDDALGSRQDTYPQPGWILPTATKILINVTETEYEDTWTGQVEGSEEDGMFLRTPLCFRCLFDAAKPVVLRQRRGINVTFLTGITVLIPPSCHYSKNDTSSLIFVQV
jgi:hypothetical protein